MTILRGSVVSEWHDDQDRPRIVNSAKGEYLARETGKRFYPLDEIESMGS